MPRMNAIILGRSIEKHPWILHAIFHVLIRKETNGSPHVASVIWIAILLHPTMAREKLVIPKHIQKRNLDDCLEKGPAA